MTGTTIKCFHWVAQMMNTTSAKSAIEIVIKIRNLVTFDILFATRYLDAQRITDPANPTMHRASIIPFPPPLRAF